MTFPLRFAGAALLSAAALALGPATAATASGSGSGGFVYYVNFILDGQVVGQGQVGCFDEPIEYILIWGIDQGEMEILGRESCSPFPPPLP